MDTTSTLAAQSATSFWNANMETMPIPSPLVDDDVEVSTADCLPAVRQEGAKSRFIDIVHMPTGYTLKSIPAVPGLLCQAYSKGMGIFAYSYALLGLNKHSRPPGFRVVFYRMLDHDIQTLFQAHSDSEIFSLALSDDEICFCAGRKGDTIYGRSPTGTYDDCNLFVLDHIDNSVAYTTALSGQHIVMSGTKSGQVLIWDLRRGRCPVGRFTPCGAGAAVRSLRATSDGQRIVVLHDNHDRDTLFASWDARKLNNFRPPVSYQLSPGADTSGPVLFYDFDEARSGGLLTAVSTMGDLAFWDVKIGGEATLEFGTTEDVVPSELSMFGWDDESDSVTPGIFVRNCASNIILTPGNDVTIGNW